MAAMAGGESGGAAHRVFKRCRRNEIENDWRGGAASAARIGGGVGSVNSGAWRRWKQTSMSAARRQEEKVINKIYELMKQNYLRLL